MEKTILIVDDEIAHLSILSDILKYKGYKILEAAEGTKALDIIKNNSIDLVLLDLVMPGMSGMEVLQKSLETKPNLPVIMISAHGTIKTAVDATKLGAQDFLEKPLETERILITVKNILEKEELRHDRERLLEKVMHQCGMVGISPAIKHIYDFINRVAPTEAWVMISGETGTGKELLARALHENSNRSSFPFCPVNCAAIPEELIESELFGYKKGAFTGAVIDKTGKIKAAHKGTLFLDEIADMSMSTQAKILRVLEEGQFQPLGNNKTEEVDIRVISATNKDLQKEVKEGRFREDLFFRLNVIDITVPPLRKRKDDIPVLIDHFIAKYSMKNNTPQKSFSQKALSRLLSYEWPGNVRELENFVEKSIILSPKNVIDLPDITGLMKTEKTNNQSSQPVTHKEATEEFERNLIINALIENHWRVSTTAKKLNLERTNLYKKMNKLGIKKE